MFVYIARRAQMGEILSEGRRVPSRRAVPIEHPRDLPKFEPLSVAAVWSRDPEVYRELPELLLTNDGGERDWLAWLVNFAPSMRPFTAFCRVLGRSNFAERFDSFQVPDLGTLANACLGLVLGEVLSTEEGLARVREPLTTSAFASVLAFSLVRELAIYKNEAADEDDLPRRWWLVRQLTRQRERSLEVSEVIAVARVIGSLLRNRPYSGFDAPVRHACQELLSEGSLSSTAAAFGPFFADTVRDIQGTREERLEVFERALRASMVALPSMDEAFTLGYLASRINPGTLAHAPLLAPALQRHSSVMLWYGVCAGLSKECSLAGEFGGVGRRVLRDLLVQDYLMARPRVDIAAAELEVILAGERHDEFPVTSPSQLSVELAPGISTVVNWSSRARTRRPSEEVSKPDERGWILEELGTSISQLLELHRRVRGTFAQEPEPEPAQRALFEKRPERRGTKKR